MSMKQGEHSQSQICETQQELLIYFIFVQLLHDSLIPVSILRLKKEDTKEFAWMSDGPVQCEILALPLEFTLAVR